MGNFLMGRDLYIRPLCLLPHLHLSSSYPPSEPSSDSISSFSSFWYSILLLSHEPLKMIDSFSSLSSHCNLCLFF